jgi:hypothetical protein
VFKIYVAEPSIVDKFSEKRFEFAKNLTNYGFSGRYF